MKAIFTLVAACLVTASLHAQSWEEGQDVTAELAWQCYDGTEEGADVWQTTDCTAGYDYNSWEIYQGAEGAEFYQVFYLPAGVYTFKCQGFYRGDYTNYWDGTEVIRAVMFAESVDEDGANVTRTQSADLVSIASSECFTRYTVVYDDNGDEAWGTDVSYEVDGSTYYIPNTMQGAEAFFNAGYYDDNELTVIQLEDGYIKFGIRKTSYQDWDWCIFRNFRATYEGEAGEAVLLQQAQEQFSAIEEEAGELEGSFEDYEALYNSYFEEKNALLDQYYGSSTVEEYEEGIAAIEAVMEKYKGYLQDALGITTLIELAQSDIDNFSYGDTSELIAAISSAQSTVSNATSPSDYSDAAALVGEARMNYSMNAGDQGDGSYAVTNIVANAFFCLPQYMPTKVNGEWTYSDEVLNGDGTLEGWSGVGESSGGETASTTTRVAIASGLSLDTDTTVIYKWYRTGGIGYNYYWNHGMSSAKAWATPTTESTIAQNLIGLPDGYYSIKGMGITWNNDWTDEPNMGIRLSSDGTTVQSTESTYESGWWGYDKADWTEYTTGMLHVTNGKARVEFFADGFSSFTAMQLIYYGATPDFTLLLSDDIAEARTNASALVLKGDIAHVDSILGTIPDELTTYDEYAAGLASVDEANTYTTTAISTLEANDATQLFADLEESMSDHYADNEDSAFRTAVSDALGTALLNAFDAYDAEDAVYTDIVALVADEAAYENYFSTIDIYMANVQSDALMTLIKEQLNEMAVTYADSQAISDYLTALAGVYNSAILNDLGMENATESNPIDVTVLLVNPSFTDGTNGWYGEPAVDDSLQNAEMYATDFNVYQIVRNLPAGAYEVRVKSFYRDGYLEAAYTHARYDEDGGFQPNTILYANDNQNTVVSIANEDANWTERSFTSYTFWGTNPNPAEGESGDVLLTAWMEETVDEDGNYTVTSYQQDYDNENNIITETLDNAWIYDAWYTDGDTRYFFPNSMRGSYYRFLNDGGAYSNSVQTMVEEGGSITLGLKKETTIDGDWCIFDDFELYYLGTETPTAIEGVSAAGSGSSVKSIYTTDGRMVSRMQRGVNIVRMADGTVRKVLVK